MKKTQDTFVEMTAFMREIVARYDDGIPHEDTTIMAGLLRAHRESKTSTLDEMLANCVLLLFAGHETTTLLIANTALALLENPRQREAAAQSPAGIAAAVTETLRYYSPVQMVRRQAAEDIAIRGTDIRRGEMVWLSIGAANRDPRQFRDAGMFDLHREESRNLAFGAGPHYCLGASLSVMEAEVALSRLFLAFPDIQLDRSKPCAWLPNPTARGLSALPAVW
jgi:cytochrome P450